MTSYVNRVKRNQIRVEDRVLQGMVVHTCNHNPWKEVIKIRSSKTTSDSQQVGGQPDLHETCKHSACQCLKGKPLSMAGSQHTPEVLLGRWLRKVGVEARTRAYL